jgi:hypothetical protein
MLHKFDNCFTVRIAGLVACLLVGFGPSQLFADQSVTLTWSPSADTNAVGYKIYYGGASGAYTNTLDVGNATNVTVAGLSEGNTYYFSATTVSSAGVESAFSNEASYAIPTNTNNVISLPPPANQPVSSNPTPALDAITNIIVYQNSGPQTVALTGIASNSTNWNFVGLQAYSSDPTIIPAPTIAYTSPASTGVLTFTPVANALGTVTVTVTANNSVNNFSQTFTITVVQAPAVAVSVPSVPPTLAPLANVTVQENSGVATVNLSGISAGSPNSQPLIVSVVSSNTAVVPTPLVNYTNPATTGTLVFAPATNAIGASIITVTLNNGNASNNLVTQSFLVTVLSNGSPTLNPIADLSVQEGSAAQVITLTGITPGTTGGRQPLRITTSSSNPRVVPAPSVRYVSGASTAALTLRFGPTSSGQAVITVFVNNGGRSNNVVSQSFNVTVVPIPPPTLDPIGNLTVVTNSAPQTITLTGISAGPQSGNHVLHVTATATNHRLPQPVITYTSPGSNAVLTFTPGRVTGSTLVTVTVSDGLRISGSFKQTFTINVIAALPPVPSVAAAAAPAAPAAPAVPAGGTSTTEISVNSDAAATLTPVASAPGQFNFQVTGLTTGQYVVQSSPDMSNWTPVLTNTAPFTVQTSTQGGTRQFYRAYYLPSTQP